MAWTWVWGSGDDRDDFPTDDDKLTDAEIALGMPDDSEVNNLGQHVRKCAIRYQVTARTSRDIKHAVNTIGRRQKEATRQTRIALIGLAALILFTSEQARTFLATLWSLLP